MEVATTLKLRLFCALEIGAAAREQIAVYGANLRQQFLSLRVAWDKPEKLHLTLKFFGDVRPAQLAEIIAAADLVAARHHAFELQISGAGVFPLRSTPSVLWLGVKDGNAAVMRLQADFETECPQRGFATEPREFTPHLTIARVKERTPASHSLAQQHLAADFTAPAFFVRQIALIQSTLQPRGAIYRTLYLAELKTK